jgi:hypothetical protein
MSRWYGVVGYGETNQTEPGIWEDSITERKYYGDVIRIANRWSANTESTNDDLNLNSQISIVADPFAYQKFHSIKYVEFMGAKWKVTNVEVLRPRLLLTIGGVYNEQAVRVT